jgi:hypothetical protein
MELIIRSYLVGGAGTVSDTALISNDSLYIEMYSQHYLIPKSHGMLNKNPRSQQSKQQSNPNVIISQHASLYSMYRIYSLHP